MSLFQHLRKDLKLSVKTVRSHYTRYISFAVVILFISFLICTITTLNHNHQSTQRAYLEERYVSDFGDVYHFQMIGLNQEQFSILRQFEIEQTDTDKIFAIVGGVEATISGTQDKRYDVDIQLKGNIDEAYDTFLGRYTKALIAESPDAQGIDLDAIDLDEIEANYSVVKTPLLDFELSVLGNTIIFLLLIALIVAAGSAAIWILHSTMINHYKFTYGIYVTFGANFVRLFFTAFWEQLWIVLATWVPASLISLLVSWLVFKRTGLAFGIYWLGFLWALLLTLLTVAIAIFISIRAASSKTPNALISAADNSNFIHSPRTSADFVGGRFPATIGKITYRRYWKYTFRLMASTLAFSMLFVGASTVAYCYDRVVSLDEPEISVSFDIPYLYNEVEDKPVTDYSDYGYNAEKSTLISALPNVHTVLKCASYTASEVCSHVKIDKSISKLGSGGVNVSGLSGDSKAYLNVDYNAIDEELITAFEKLGYEIEGSLESVLQNDRTVAVTGGFLGASKFDWEVGDTVWVADLPDEDVKNKLISVENDLLTANKDKLLSAWLGNAVFSYTKYTVGAIISEIPTDQNWGIYFNEKNYKTVTGYTATYNDLEIYTVEGTTEEDISDLYYSLRHVADYYTNMKVTNLDTATLRAMELNKNYSAIITMIAYVLLAVCPLIWFLSQSLFYQKRQQELELLQSLGASTASIKKYLMGDAIRFAITGGLLFAVLAPIVSWVMHRLVGYIMMFAGGTMLASFQLPVVPYILGILINVFCGFATCYAAWLNYIKKCPMIFYEKGNSDEPNQTVEIKEASV